MRSEKQTIHDLRDSLKVIDMRLDALQSLAGAANPEASMKHVADAMGLATNVSQVLFQLSERYSKALWKQQAKERER